MKWLYTLLMTGILGALTGPVFAQWQQALPETPPIPADNPQSAAKIKLGKTLFLDPRLSSTEIGRASCRERV